MESRIRTAGTMGDQRTGRHSLTLTFIPENVPLEQALDDLADRMTRIVKKATDDGRKYDIQVRITADITVDATQARVDEYITELPIDVPKDVGTVETDGVLFRRTALGWERVE